MCACIILPLITVKTKEQILYAIYFIIAYFIEMSSLTKGIQTKIMLNRLNSQEKK